MRSFYTVHQKAEAVKAFSEHMDLPATAKLRDPIRESLNYTKKQTGVEWASVALWYLHAACDPHSDVYKAVRDLAKDSDCELKIRRIQF